MQKTTHDILPCRRCRLRISAIADRSARTPKFDKTTLKKQQKTQNVAAKRMSLAYPHHPAAYMTGYQYASQQIMPQRQHFQMWQARSMDGLGKKDEKFSLKTICRMLKANVFSCHFVRLSISVQR